MKDEPYWQPDWQWDGQPMPFEQRGQEPSRKPAIWSLILAFLPLCLTQVAAITLAIIVLSTSRNGRKPGKRLAIGALVVSCLWVVALGVAVAIDISNDAERDSSGDVAQRGDISIFELRVGDCVVDNLDDEFYRTVTVTPCDETYRFQVFAVFELSDGDFPGDDDVFRLAEGGCIKRFEDFVGSTYDESSLETYSLSPDSRSWRLDDREVTCLLTTGSERKGSLKGSGATLG